MNFKEKAEELAKEIHEKDMEPGPIGTTVNFTGATSDRIESALREAYREGLEEGVRMYDWWKDGEQQVGCCGNTLKEALAALWEKKEGE